MATFTVNDSSYTWDVGGLQDYFIRSISVASADQYQLVYTGLNINFETYTSTLNGFFYTIGEEVFGWIASISFEVGGTTVMSATDFLIDFTEYSTMEASDFVQSVTLGHDVFTINSSRSSIWELGYGDDTINAGTGDDSIYGGSGTDLLIIDDSIAGIEIQSVSVNTYLRTAEGYDRLNSIELIQFNDLTVSLQTGNSSDNHLSGDRQSTSNHDVILGGTGDDTLLGLSGNDRLYGETGDDRIEGESGRDRLLGDTGNDSLWGGSGGDRLFGGADDDKLNGGGGRDRLFGGSGNDRLFGGNGRDTLSGGDGNDVLLGHKGDDLLAGGAHADIFVFHQGHGNDTITDFTAGEDHIRIGRGADDMGGLQFQAQGDDVLVSFADVTILVEDITVAQLQDADNFLF